MSQLTELDFERILRGQRDLVKAKASPSASGDWLSSQLPADEDMQAYCQWARAARKKMRQEQQQAVSVPSHQEYRQELESTNPQYRCSRFVCLLPFLISAPSLDPC
jgi:hypothetical protein